VLFKLLTLIIFLGIFLTKSRTAIFVSTVFGGYYFYNYIKNSSKVLKILMIFLILALFYITSLKCNVGTYFFDRIIWWKAAWKMFLDNPFKGVGWGNFENFYLYLRPALSVNSIYAHNIFLQILAETGLFGFLSFSMLGYFYLAKIKATKENIFPTREIIIVCLTGFLAFNLLDYSFYIPAHMMLFWVVLGAGFKSESYKREKPFLNPLILVFLICLISFPIISFFSASIHYQRGSLNLANNNFSGAKQEFERAIKYDSYPSIYFSKSAQLYFKLYSQNKDGQNLNAAIFFQNQAIKRNKLNSVYWSDLSWLYWTKGDMGKSVEAIKKAVEYDKLNPHYQLTLKKFIGNSKK
ncbi:MAG: O-antigen ligase family protein, partial [Elusimicrobia bacterium]|nr:O-antigen ligase family protein [Elusimicrobiota bacterium]